MGQISSAGVMIFAGVIFVIGTVFDFNFWAINEAVKIVRNDSGIWEELNRRIIPKVPKTDVIKNFVSIFNL